MPRLLSNQGLQLCHIVLLALTTNAFFPKQIVLFKLHILLFKKLLFCHIYIVARLFDHFYLMAGWAEEEVQGGEVLGQAGGVVAPLAQHTFLSATSICQQQHSFVTFQPTCQFVPCL